MSNVELGVQTEKAFQKQPIFQNSKAARKTTRDRRWYKDVGLGFKTPRAAIDGTYIGKHPTLAIASHPPSTQNHDFSASPSMLQQHVATFSMDIRTAFIRQQIQQQEAGCRKRRIREADTIAEAMPI